MKLLIIGGTRFVGRHIVEEALKHNHHVTLFNRGNNKHIFPNVDYLHGDRNSDVSQLKSHHFDAVIDTCGYTPQQLALTNQVLKGIKHYTFISTISVYADPLELFANEDDALKELEQPTTEVTNESYGPLKVLCEEDIQKNFPQSLILRPGIIVGPYDPTDRFSYWVWRIKQGGTIAVPGRMNAPLQFIDARDLAVFTLDAIEKSLTGIFNVVTPPNSLCFGDLVNTALQITHANTEVKWINEAFLETHESLDFPLWVPEAYQSWWQVSSRKAVENGLQFRNLEITITDTLYWLSTLRDYQPKAGLSKDQEKTLLRDWVTSSHG